MAGARAANVPDKVAVLRSSELFSGLRDDLLRKIAAVAVTRPLKRGQVLYSEHDEASGLYIVSSGEFRAIRQTVGGRELVLSTEHAGAVLALSPVFNGGKFYSTIVAETAAEVICIQTRDVHELCHQHAELLWNVARVMSHRVRLYAGLIETLALRNVDQRVAQYLVTTAQERGVRRGAGYLLELTLTRGEIANRIGSTREVVSRALARLQRDKLIEMTGRRLIFIPEMRTLATFADLESHQENAMPPANLSSEFA